MTEVCRRRLDWRTRVSDVHSHILTVMHISWASPGGGGGGGGGD